MFTPFSHKVKRISAMLPVADMDATLDFYVEVLRFNVALDAPDYSIIDCDGATIHLVKAASSEILAAVKGKLEIYIEVENIESLWAHVKQFRDRYQIRDLFAQPYGMVEFHILDPNEYLLFIGQSVPSDVCVPPV